MSQAVNIVVALVVGALGFVYYLFFGDDELTPSVHGHLTQERLRRLLAEAFSYGTHGAEFVIAKEDKTPVLSLRKEIRAINDVHLVCDSIDAAGEDAAKASLSTLVSIQWASNNGALAIDFHEDVSSAGAFAQEFVSRRGGRLEQGHVFFARGVGLAARVGWSH